MAVKIGTDPNIPVGRTSEVTTIAITTFLEKDENLADVPDPATARSNLGITDGTQPYTYIAFADKLDGTGFTTTYADTKLFWAVKVSATELTPVVGDFANLWTPFEKHRDDKYPTYSNNRLVGFGADEAIGGYRGNVMGRTSASPGCYHYKGTYNRIYFIIYDQISDGEGNTRSGHSTLSYINYYDIDKGIFGPLVSLPSDWPSNTDYHDVPCITVMDNGKILIVKETLESAGTGHNSDMEIWLSNAAETIEDPVSPGSHYFTMVLQIDSTQGLYTGLSYPRIVKGAAQGEVFLIFRGEISGERPYLSAIKSDDYGATWESLAGAANTLSLIAQCDNWGGSPVDEWFFYNYPPTGLERGGIYIVGFLNEGGAGGTSPDTSAAANRYKTFVYLYSADGITWENAESQFSKGSGEFSKNVVSVAPITSAELDANFVVDDVRTDLYHSFSYQSFSVDQNGIPFILNRTFYVYSSPSGNTNKSNQTIDASIWYWDTVTGAWIEVDIGRLYADQRAPYNLITDVPVNLNRTLVIAYKDGILDVIVRRVNERQDTRHVAADQYPAIKEIDATSEIVVQQIYRVTATQVSHFGVGIVVGDYIVAGASTTCDANNKLMPLFMETCFWRTHDYGTTWYQVREPYTHRANPHCSVAPSAEVNFNYMDSGYLSLFLGVNVQIDDTTLAMDHTEWALFIDKIQM
jgi:hypothetical protein